MQTVQQNIIAFKAKISDLENEHGVKSEVIEKSVSNE
jgi:hypothetical protein